MHMYIIFIFSQRFTFLGYQMNEQGQYSEDVKLLALEKDFKIQ